MRTVFQLIGMRYLLSRWDRAALIVASIALGVATLVSTRILNRCIEVAATENATPLGMGDLYVSNGEIGVQRKIANDIRDANIPGVQSVQPVVIDRVTLPQAENIAAVLLGVELATHQLPEGTSLLDLINKRKIAEVLNQGHNALQARFTDVDFAFKHFLTRRAIVPTKTLYDQWVANRKSEDDPFVLKFGGNSIDCVPIAYVEYGDESPLHSLGTNIIGMDIGHAAEFLRADASRVNRIDVLIKKDANKDTVRAAIATVVGDRAGVRTPEEQGKSTQEIISGIQIGFTLCSVGAMVVGLFLVYNALAVTVAERRHDIGVLRSIGASRAQIITLFGLAALVLGGVGGLLGIPLGIGLARFAIDLISEDMSSIFTNPSANLWLPTIGTVIAALIAGAGTATFAALIPAIQAAYQDPADVVRRTPGGVGGGWRVAHRSICAMLVAGGFAMILTRADLPPRVGAFGGMVTTLVGLLLAMPIFVGVSVGILQPILRRILPIEARLAADNLIRSPGRTGLVIGALAAGVAVMTQTAGVGKSNEEPVTEWLDEVIQADQFVAGGKVSEAVSSVCPIDPKILPELRGLTGVQSVAGVRYVRPEYNGTVVWLTAIDVEHFVDASQARGPGGLPHLDKFRKLRDVDGVVISDNFASRHNVHVGSTITLAGPVGPVQLKVLDTVRDYSWSRGTLFMDRAVYARVFQDPQVDIAHIFATHNSEPERLEARQRVSQYASDRGYLTEDKNVLRKMLGDLIERVYKLVHLQQIVVGIVASLGVVTSLLISVLQRKRELGLLLAVGATPSQVVRTVLAEAMLMGAFGTILGLMLGIPLEWYVVRVVLFEESGFLFEVLMPWKQAIGISAGAMIVATLAGLLPAMRAVKTRIPDAIAYE